MLHIINFEKYLSEASLNALCKLTEPDDSVVLINLDDNRSKTVTKFLESLQHNEIYTLTDYPDSNLPPYKGLHAINNQQFIQLCVEHSPINSWY